MMGLQVSKGTRVEVRQWWIATKTHQQLFFQLMAYDSLVTIKFHDIDAVIQQLEADYCHLQETDFPHSAEVIRGHLLQALGHVKDSLWSLRNQELFESDIRFSIAQIDYTMVEHELLEYGIMD